MGIVTSAVAYSAGEHSAFMPVAGGFVGHATRFIEPAMGAATGWNFWYAIAITAPADLSAAATLVEYWNDKINPSVWITIFLVFTVTVNFLNVRLYGEV
ncbi:hypothetical protein KEM55_006232 [Ascosphaera atra]|nr:hypothetical protein KEM55_006232 [Ascosphaera atra]